MHQLGDYVTYKDSGICKIVEDNNEYYILEPVYSKNMTMYVPKQTQALVEQMLAVLSKDEIDNLIIASTQVEHQWIDDSKKRYEEFNKMLRSGNKADLLWLIKVLSAHKKELEEKKKNFYATDKRILSAAEKIITEEFAFVLEMEPGQVMGYIENLINNK